MQPLYDHNPLIRLRGVTRSFGKGQAVVRALRGVDLDVFGGELLILAGPSGCGKTTLVSIISGVLDADGGDVSVFGQDWGELTGAQKAHRRASLVGFVFQQFNLVPTLSAEMNVAVPLLINGMPRSKALARAREVLAQVGLGDRAKARPHQLSGGMQQRVAIARAIARDVRLLVCDEPTANLDSGTGHQVMELIHAMSHPTESGEPRCVIVVTHDPRVFDLADCIERMEDGVIVPGIATGPAPASLPHSRTLTP
jgi:putative ABC transport system ATP-binding protein